MTPAELARIHQASFETPRPWSEAEILDSLGTSGCFLERAAGGFLIGRVIVDEAELLTLAVDPAMRRQGIGLTLVKRFLNHAKDRGAQTGFLEVAADNQAACALYQSVGFVESATRKRYYSAPDGTKVDAKIMTIAFN